MLLIPVGAAAAAFSSHVRPACSGSPQLGVPGIREASQRRFELFMEYLKLLVSSHTNADH